MHTPNSASPGISVILPVRDGGDYLDVAVASILQQSHVNLELIIVDDHSRDGAIHHLDKSDPRLRILASPTRGIVAALNAGIDKARHPYIARMDADDIARPRRLQTQLDYLLAHPEIQVCGACVNIFRDGDTTGGGYRRYQDWINALTKPDEIALSMFIECPIPHPSAMMHRYHLQTLGRYQDCDWPEDYDLWLRAHLRKFRFGKPNGVLLDWRDHNTRLSRASSRYNKQAFFRAKACYLAKAHPNRNFRIWGAGPTGAMLHDELAKYGCQITGFIDIAPRRINNLKRGKPVVDAYQLSKTTDLVLTAVNARDARADIKSFLNQHRFVEGEDYLCMT